jgi:hypothetical protein
MLVVEHLSALEYKPSDLQASGTSRKHDLPQIQQRRSWRRSAPGWRGSCMT